jgi:hypothetical protein
MKSLGRLKRPAVNNVEAESPLEGESDAAAADEKYVLRETIANRGILAAAQPCELLPTLYWFARVVTALDNRGVSRACRTTFPCFANKLEETDKPVGNILNSKWKGDFVQKRAY